MNIYKIKVKRIQIDKKKTNNKQSIASLDCSMNSRLASIAATLRKSVQIGGNCPFRSTRHRVSKQSFISDL